MLAIRMQRTGRKGHAQFRLVVQDSRFSPTSGRVVAYLGSYNPHTKVAAFDKEKATKYLNNGAQPSDRVARLLKKEGMKLPTWVKLADPVKRTTRNPEKLRRNRPAEAAAPEPAPAEEAEAQPDAAAETEAPAEEASEAEIPASPEPAEAPASEPEPDKT